MREAVGDYITDCYNSEEDEDNSDDDGNYNIIMVEDVSDDPDECSS